MTECLFCRIVRGELPTSVVWESDRLLAFRDVAPQAPTHVLVVPKSHHGDVSELVEADPAVATELLGAAARIAKLEGLDSYRLVFNTGEESGQTVFHAHMHVLGGRRLGHLC